MAHKLEQACELFIDQEIDGGLGEGKTPHTIGKELSIWVEELFKAKVSPDAIRMRASRKRLKKPRTTVQSDKSVKTQTKPEVKIQISKVAKEVRSGAVSDDHAKELGDALGDAIDRGVCAKRVGTKTATAVKKANKKTKEVKPKEVDNYQRLEKHVTGATNGLQLLADGSIPSPVSEKEADAAICIKAALPNLCLQIARLGINLIEINEIYYKGDENGKREKDQFLSDLKL